VKYSSANSTNVFFYTTSNFKYEKEQARFLIPFYPPLVAMDSFTVSQETIFHILDNRLPCGGRLSAVNSNECVPSL